MKTINNPIHQQLLKKFTELESSDNKNKEWVKKYLGTDKNYHGIPSKDMNAIATSLIKENNFDEKKLIDLLNSLYTNGSSFTELAIAASLLGRHQKIKEKMDLSNLDNWLNYTHGWAEIDVLCQSNFTAKEVLSRWSEWKKLLKKFLVDKNISKRRASLVLLTKPLRQSDDSRLSELAFEQVEKLKHEKEILITKAVSWVLRALVKFHKDEVLAYLKENKGSLPSIAYREALSKAETGRKYNKKN
jgi:3-methyladenine DNA glycosylase AlkD